MTISKTHFQYCPKLAVFDAGRTQLLLCRRRGEADYDGVFSLIGGKMEHEDASIVEAIRREKNEEVGRDFAIRVLPYYSVDVSFTKADGNRMILPHYYAEHIRGEPVLSEEYSEFRWIDIRNLTSCAPIVENIKWIGPLLLRVGSNASAVEFVVL